jgi:signal peptidase II
MRLADPRLFRWALVLACLIVLLDQASKLWLFHVLLRDSDEIVLAPVFSLVKRYNLGISFSFLSTDHPLGRWALSGLALGISAILVVWLTRTVDRIAATGLGLIVGGAFGNVIDRLRVGAVQDFLLFHWREWAWPAFNLADSAITVGVGLLLIDGFAMRGRREPVAGPD